MPQAENIHGTNVEAAPQGESAENISDPRAASWEQFEDTEQAERQTADLHRKIGAKLLSSASFEKRHQDIVDSSFRRAEHLPSGSGAERRNFAYLSRLEDLVSKHGNRLEQRLWQASARDLIIRTENITDAYWRSQEELVRNQTGERIVIDQGEKNVLTREIQSKQSESLKSWSDYLGDKNSTYPMWFKVYAWDGMSKMSGVFDTEKKQFKKRDIHTVSPYPKLNPAALAKVYDIVTDFYGIGDAQTGADEEDTSDAQLNSLVTSGNFSKLYAKMLLDTKVTVKTPERAQDVSGEWVEYLPGDEERLAEAAEGTPWCIVSPSMGRSYLTTGEYGDIDEDDENDTESRAKFILFHLHDPATGQPSSSACASIRLGADGRVAEISGLADGSTQRVEDALLPTVEEKVKTLPGGEEYLQAFADTKYLTKLTHKFEDGEPFNAEELAFIFETDRGIVTLNTYGRDPRIDELQGGVDRLLENGTDVNLLLEVIGPREIANNFDALVGHGANIDINELVQSLEPQDIITNLDSLVSHGANIDINELVQSLEPQDIITNLDSLVSHGAIDVNEFVRQLNPVDISLSLEALLSSGADVNQVIQMIGPDIEPMAWDLNDNFNTLIAHGADVNQIAQRLTPNNTVKHLDDLLAHGATIDVNELAQNLEPYEINFYLGRLLDHGLSVDQAMPVLTSWGASYYLDKLLAHGADANQLMTFDLDPSSVAANLDDLITNGADPRLVFQKLQEKDMDDRYGWDYLLPEQQERLQNTINQLPPTETS